MPKPDPLTNRERVARRRAALRAEGLRPRQIWVPDLRRPEVQDLISRSCRRINEAMRQSDDMAFVEAVQYWPGDEEG